MPHARHEKLRKSDIGHLRALFADVDPVGGAAELAGARADLVDLAFNLMNGDLPPSFAIDSGGGFQFLWMLAKKLPAGDWQAAVEAQNIALRDKLDGDNVQNIDRLMRLPGTINIPTPEKRAKGRTERRAAVVNNVETRRGFSLEQVADYYPPSATASANTVDRNPDIETVRQQIGDTSPTFTTPGEATRLQLPAYVNQGAQAKPTNYRTPDGKQGTAVIGAANKLVDTQSGQPLPEGTITFGTNVQGSAADTGISTQANQTEATRREAELNYGMARIGDFRKLLAENPGVLGIPGTIRGVAQDIRNAVQETTAAYGKDIPAFQSIEEMKTFIDGVAQKNGYDPSIRQAQALAAEMAYIDAKAADPSGEVPVREWERLINKYDGGLSGNAGALAALDVLEQSMRTRMSQQVGTLRSPGQVQAQVVDHLDGRTATNSAGEKLVRRNGKWGPAQ